MTALAGQRSAKRPENSPNCQTLGVCARSRPQTLPQGEAKCGVAKAQLDTPWSVQTLKRQRCLDVGPFCASLTCRGLWTCTDAGNAGVFAKLFHSAGRVLSIADCNSCRLRFGILQRHARHGRMLLRIA